ncbi:MAG: VCBS repeat-containing protein [Flavobacteriales bacterium]|nr:VCBS repeat-containing protein [Flavobacteriales bacterium]
MNKPSSPKYQSMNWVTNYDVKPGTTGMVELLDSIYRWDEKRKNEQSQISPFNKLVHVFYKSRQQLLSGARELLHEGETNEAIHILEELSDEIVNESDELFTKYNELLAIAYLRWGEQENCIINHNHNSCILPIKENGIYALQDNTRKAIEVYLKLLNKHPDDWKYRWLINIAYQTLGEYPSKVPKQWLIQSELMVDKDSSDNFKNIAPLLKVDETSGAGGAVLEDFNNDGLLDIMTSGLLSTNQLKYYVNNGKDGFSDQTIPAQLEGLTSGFNIYPLDYNNDGWKDLLVVRGSWGRLNGRYPNSLLRNNQDGTFSDITVEAGLLSFMPVATAVCADFNNDGWTDIYIGNESVVNTEIEKANELYINNGKGQFIETSVQSGTDINAFTKGLCAGDYNNDGLIDLFISNHNGINSLLKNNGNDDKGIPQFVNTTITAGVGNRFLVSLLGFGIMTTMVG